MDEQQIIQILNQIPLETLMQYVQQRAQAEQQQAGMEDYAQGYDQGAANQGYADQGYGGGVPQEAMAAQQGAPMMARGGRLGYYTPYINPYNLGGCLSIPKSVRKKRR